ncbi:MAG: BatA domain-containing protein, partial [Elusimicrobia bacterium]|nr:BatA domain-containing protein [Elusimicrobiota bacterium]
MSFSEPAVLWALPLAAAPLLLQLFWRRPRGRRPFSDLSLLRRVSERLLPRSRLRQWLLAALRSLLLLSLILAFAGPVLSGRAEASRRGAAPRRLDLVVLVDESYSMGYRQDGRSRFDLARSQLSGLLRALGPADRVALIPFSDRLESVRPAEWLSPSLALDVLPRLSSGWRATDYAPPLEAAAVLLRGDTRARRVVLLLGDGARHGLRGPLPTLPPGVLFFGLRWPQASNAWISSAAAEDAAPSPKLLVRLEGISAARSLELWKDGRLSGSSLLSAGAGSASLALPQAPPQGGGAWSGKLALRADDLPADDSYFVSLSYPARPRLLCLYGDPGFFRLPAAGYFLRKLFGQDRGSLLPFNADFLDVARLPQARLSDYQMALLCDVRGVTAEAAARLEGFVRAGGSLLVAPGPGGLEGLEALAAALPARWGPVVEGEGGGLAAGPGALPGQWSGYELGKVSLRRYQLLSPKPGARLLLRSADGYPLLVCAALGRGRAALWASTIDAAWTDLPLKPVFPAWLEAGLGLARVSAGAKRPRLQLKVGEPLRRVWNADEPVPQSVRLRDPRGREQTLWPR